jgi:hypothetical protein
MSRLTILTIWLLIAILCGSLFAADVPPTIQSLNKMPLAFTKNKGQWDARVLFRTNAGGATMWFTKEGVTYQFTRRIPLPPPALPEGEGWSKTGERAIHFDRFGNTRDSIEQLVLTAKFVGANPDLEVVSDGLMEYKCNYFLGNDPAKWHNDVPNYEAVTLKDIYPGIDLKFSADGNGQAAYKFIAAPGADITQIKVTYEGAEETSLDAEGRLILKTKWGAMIAAITTPTNGVLSGRGSSSTLSEKTIGFEADGVNRQALGTLSIGLVYSTYLGGNNSENYYGGGNIAVDVNGNAYLTGATMSSNFPIQNPYDGSYNGGTYFGDVYVTMLSANGNSLIYSTFLGGGSDDIGYDIAVDGGGSVYVTGATASTTFPTLNPYQLYMQGESDAFVFKLSSSGNSLTYSTYLGGGGSLGYSGDAGRSIAIDDGGYAYVTGQTSSSSFPTKNPYQAAYQGGGCDAFVTKLGTSGNSLIYSTYLGGTDQDRGVDIAVDDGGNAYVAGQTPSPNFPTKNAFQATYQGGHSDAFVSKFSTTGGLVYSTFLGGSGAEDYYMGVGIVLDGGGNAYVTGSTSSTDFPTKNANDGSFNGGLYDGDAFVTKLSSSGSSLIYSTYLGGSDEDRGAGITVDGNGNAYVTGRTKSSDFPTLNPYQTAQSGYDVFMTKFSTSGTRLIYSTYLGGGGLDDALGIAVDVNACAYVTGLTMSSNFPTLNAYQSAYQSATTDAFVTKLGNCAADADCDGIVDGSDNCLNEPNSNQQNFDGDGFGDACDNCPFTYNTLQEDANHDGVGDSCTFATPTPPGSDVVVPLNPSVGLTFGTVSAGGTTSLTVGTNGPPASGAFTIVPANQSMYFNLSTTATYSGQIEICLHYDKTWFTPTPETMLSLHHFDNTVWSDITTSLDTAANMICGVTDSLSPFVLAVSSVNCGDADGEGTVDIADVVYLIAYIFSSGPAPMPLTAGDADCDGGITIADAVYLVAYIFSGGPAPCAGCK